MRTTPQTRAARRRSSTGQPKSSIRVNADPLITRAGLRRWLDTHAAPSTGNVGFRRTRRAAGQIASTTRSGAGSEPSAESESTWRSRRLNASSRLPIFAAIESVHSAEHFSLARRVLNSEAEPRRAVFEDANAVHLPQLADGIAGGALVCHVLLRGFE
jgi:hypothetical protein